MSRISINLILMKVCALVVQKNSKKILDLKVKMKCRKRIIRRIKICQFRVKRRRIQKKKKRKGSKARNSNFIHPYIMNPANGSYIVSPEINSFQSMTPQIIYYASPKPNLLLP